MIFMTVPPGLPQPAQEEKPDTRELEKVRSWRRDYLVRAGYDLEAARLIAESKADLHFAGDLLGRGCPATTALLILL